MVAASQLSGLSYRILDPRSTLSSHHTPPLHGGLTSPAAPLYSYAAEGDVRTVVADKT